MTNGQIQKILDGNFKAIKQGLQDKALYGFYNGYYVLIEIQNGSNIIFVNASSSDDPKNERLGQYYQEMKIHDYAIEGVETFKHAISIQLKLAKTLSESIQQINTYVPLITNYLKNNGYSTGCFSCGTNFATELSPHLINEDSEYIYICDRCAEIIKKRYEDRKEEIRASVQKSNLALGIIGAIGGSLIGGVAWIIFYKYGKVAALAGVLGARFSLQGYKLLGKSVDKKGLFVSLIISMLVIFASHSLYWTWDMYNLGIVDNTIPFYETLFNLGSLLDANGYLRAFCADAFLGLFLAIVSLFPEFKRAFRKLNGDYTFK